MTLRPPLVLHEGFSDVDFRAPLLEQQGERGPKGGGTRCSTTTFWGVATWTHSGVERQAPGQG